MSDKHRCKESMKESRPVLCWRLKNGQKFNVGEVTFWAENVVRKDGTRRWQMKIMAPREIKINIERGNDESVYKIEA